MIRSAKDILVKPISSKDSRKMCQLYHYSKSWVSNSQLHFGVFLDGRCEGVMAFGPSMDKAKMQPLVKGTGWREFLELNRMAFSDRLPKNSESRALSVAFRLIRKHYPHIKWIVTFADGTQCGDGTIYRAAGFDLIQINKNKTILEINGQKITDITLNLAACNGTISKYLSLECYEKFKNLKGGTISKLSMLGFKKLDGFQLKYIYFLDKSSRENLTVPVLPFSKIAESGATMYKGTKRVGSIDTDASGFHSEEGGVNPTPALHSLENSL